jgi:hypothetical protein
MNTPTNQDIIFGDREVAVTKLDGSTATIKVAQMPFSRIRAYRSAEAENDEGMAVLRLVTGLDDAALGEIAAPSLFDLLDAAEAVNGPLARRSETRERMKTTRTMETMRTQYPELFDEAMQRAKSKMESAIATVGAQSSGSYQTSLPAQG